MLRCKFSFIFDTLTEHQGVRMNKTILAKRLVEIAGDLSRLAGGGIDPKRLYEKVRRGLLGTAREIGRKYPDASFKYGDSQIVGTVAGHTVTIYYDILRASNGEVAGMPVVIFDGKKHEKFYRNVADKVAELIGEPVTASIIVKKLDHVTGKDILEAYVSLYEPIESESDRAHFALKFGERLKLIVEAVRNNDFETFFKYTSLNPKNWLGKVTRALMLVIGVKMVRNQTELMQRFKEKMLDSGLVASSGRVRMTKRA